MQTDVELRHLAIDRSPVRPSRLQARRHLLTRYVLPLALLCGFISLLAWAARDALFPPHPVTVVPVLSTTAEVRTEGTPLFQAAGWIEPRPTPVRVAALAAGVVETLLVVEDQPVKAGEPVAELVKDDARFVLDRTLADQRLRIAQVEEARAALTAAATRLKRPVHLEAPLADAEAALAKLETQLENLPFEIRRARSDYEALRKDYEGKFAAKDAVSRVAIDIAKGKHDAGAALVDELDNRFAFLKQEQSALIRRRDALQTQLDLLADEIKARDESAARLQAAEARVAQADVAVAEAKLQLDRMTIRAPVDGRTYQLIAQPGARVGGSLQLLEYDGSTVVTMYDPRRLQVRVDVRFEDIPKVVLHQPVQINNPALSSPLMGRVLFISSEADIQKNTLEVKVEIPEPSPLFKPDMLVDVTFQAPAQSNPSSAPSHELKLYVPRQFIRQETDGPFVWIADQSKGVARKQRVEAGTVGHNGLVEITSGLTVASRIIAGGSDGLKDGMRIRVTGEDDSIDAGPAPLVSGSRTMHRLPRGGDQ